MAHRLRQLVPRGSGSRLAKDLGISMSTLDGYLRGGMPSADRAIALADALGVSVRWLVIGEGPERLGNATIIAEGSDIDWVKLPRYNLAAFTPEGKPEPIETIPVPKHWLNRNWYASTGLWLTAMPPNHLDGLPPEGTDVLIRDALAMTEAGTYLFFYNGVPLVRRFLDTGPSGWVGLRSADGVVAFDEPEGMRIVGRILGAMDGFTPV